jgi:L-ribulose-5-phosphate 3-epimerase
MRSRLGVMQGRLSPPINGKIQAFPVQTWQLEFQTAYNLELGGIEWTIDSHNFWGHPLIDIQKSHLVQNLREKTGFFLNTVTCDFFMQLQPWDSEIGLDEIFEMVTALANSAVLIEGLILIIPLVDSGSPKTAKDWVLLREFLHKLEPIFVKNKAKIAFEFDVEPIQQVEFVAHFESSIFGINFDSGNSASNGFDPAEELKVILPYLFNVHIKDRLFRGTTVPLGTGATDFKVIAEFFAKNPYKGNFVLQGARVEELAEEETVLRYINFCKRLGLT